MQRTYGCSASYAAVKHAACEASAARCDTTQRRGKCLYLNALTRAAAGNQGFARHPARVVRREEHGNVGDLVRLADAAERRRADRPLLQIGADDARAMRA